MAFSSLESSTQSLACEGGGTDLAELQREVAEMTSLVLTLQAEADEGLRQVIGAMDSMREESWRLSAYMELEELKERILAGDFARVSLQDECTTSDGQLAAFRDESMNKTDPR